MAPFGHPVFAPSFRSTREHRKTGPVDVDTGFVSSATRRTRRRTLALLRQDKEATRVSVLGLGLAISARWRLGRNWRMPQGAAGAGHERALCIHSSSDLHGTDFGDARIRDRREHLLGGAAGFGRRVHYLRREETVMLQLFPEQYGAYITRTGMLGPQLFGR
jgi:hypothetical protein